MFVKIIMKIDGDEGRKGKVKIYECSKFMRVQVAGKEKSFVNIQMTQNTEVVSTDLNSGDEVYVMNDNGKTIDRYCG